MGKPADMQRCAGRPAQACHPALPEPVHLTLVGRLRSAGGALGASALGALIATAAFPSAVLAHDENIYFSAQVGRASTSLRNVREVGGSFEPGTTADEPGLKDSTMFGAKVGMYSRSGVLGIEGEVYRARPHPNFGTQTFYEPTFGPFPQTRGGSHDVTTWAVNVIARVPITDRWVVHAGLGPAMVRSHLRFDNERNQSAHKWGLNGQLGVSYFINKQIAVSAELKHTRAELTFPTHLTTEGFRSDYRANHVAVSVSYAFDWASPWRAPVTVRGLLGLEPRTIGPEK